MTTSFPRLAAAVAAGALLIPAAAEAKPGNGNGHAFGHAKHGAPAPHAVVAQPAAPAPAEVAPPAAPAPAGDVSAAAILDAPAAAPVPAPTPGKASAGTTKRAAARKAAKLQTFVLHGQVTAVDAAAGTVEVAVTSGNAFGRRFAGETVVVDASAAVVEGVETDGVAGVSLGDVLAGDAVTVQARLPRSARPDGSAIAARKVVDRAERAPAPVGEATQEPEDEPADTVE